ncbi:transglycosylase domain-containing protein [Myxococcus stipitatus]|uniref:biosynthetic peptidoglycan transglycosylase n=1 Tax=Myxococcus stipitatus TaxID=83455 RepID=UPI001F446D59|nr:biosynthetic peptidoglycan transglycosylase [Myxococcus stipitatus]MCE9671228.1 transglycosylase domain-containing protein [Myxococcus stipitatus]
MARRVFSRLTKAALAAAGLLAVTLLVLIGTTPDVTPLERHLPEHTSYMRARAATLGLPEDVYRTEPMEVVTTAPLLACAVVKSEDVSFFRHGGLDWDQLMNAIASMRRQVMGASTITQQLARNLYLTPDQTVVRKLREAFIARALERKLSKHRILDIYLNVIEWGPESWGIVSAARYYFRKAPAELDVFEVSFLSAIIPAPRQPLQGANLARAERVQRRVLYQLYVSGIIEEGDWHRAMARARATFASLRQGLALEEALSCPQCRLEGDDGAEPPLVVRMEEAPLPREAWLETGCGVERNLREVRRPL